MKLSERSEDNEKFIHIYQIARKYFEYEEFIPRLKEIQTEQEWVELLSDIEQSDTP